MIKTKETKRQRKYKHNYSILLEITLYYLILVLKDNGKGGGAEYLEYPFEGNGRGARAECETWVGWYN